MQSCTLLGAYILLMLLILTGMPDGSNNIRFLKQLLKITQLPETLSSKVRNDSLHGLCPT